MQWLPTLRVLNFFFATMIFMAPTLQPRELPTIDGPEAGDLHAPPGAYLVVSRPPGEIVALCLADLTETIVRTSRKGAGWAYSISGPDSSGRIVYVENHMVEKRHLLKTIMLDGSNDTEIFTRRGDALWQHVIGEDLELTPGGGRVAFLGALKRRQMHAPKALLQTGPLEIWDLQRKQPLDVSVTALDHGLSWFPDGKRLAFVKLVQLDQIPTLAVKPSNAEMDFGRWREAPATFILNVETGEEVFLHVGWSPVVSADGASVIVADFKDRHMRVRVQTRAASPIEWPGGHWRGPIGLAHDERLVYWGLPTTGAPVRHTKNNSPLVGPKPMGSIKLADLSTGRFRTLITHIDPRRKLSLGVVASHE